LRSLSVLPLPWHSSSSQNRARAQQGAGPARPLVLTTKDRADALLSLAAAHACGTGPNIAGLVLCDAHMSHLQ
jgi:BioD-like phosphotransacetylase family protein